jgi:glycosyltransferase involved in cell wall biosynthesis
MTFVNEKEELDISVILPCLNEQNTVGQCIDDAMRFIGENDLKGEVIVVDNGSSDASADTARKHGALVIPEMRRGYGRAIRTGLENSRGTVLIISDCDTTYDLYRLGGLYFPLKGKECDVVIGDRFAGGIEAGAMPLSHRFGVPFLSWCGRKRYGVKVRDFHCGLRGLSRSAAEKSEFMTDGMEFSTEMIAKAARNGLRIAQVPVELKRCEAPRSSKLNTVKDGFRHLKFILFN